MAILTVWVQRCAEHRWLPSGLALAAIVLMVPALSAGLVGDDMIQRLTQLRPEELPPRILDTGFVSSESGKLGTVLCDLFGYLSHKDTGARAREYGIAPWWAPEAWKAALWRPLTAFTHWLDYRLFPDTPALMHAHNILWFAAAVFLAAMLYRKIAVVGCEGEMGGIGPKVPSGVCAAGLASLLFLLDKNTYAPVMYVANRGFFVSLVFGLLCFQAHIQWRKTGSRISMSLSALCLLLSLLANEGGASTLAFLMAYALVLESGTWRWRLGSLLPAAAVILCWRAVYAGSGFGVRHFVGYIDPGYSPWLFLRNLVPRMNVLLGGQLTGLPPEMNFAMSAHWQTILAVFFASFSLVCAVVFLPIVRRDTVARFWAVMLVLALIPAATVAPLSKNLGFVAVGAFGLIACFLVRFGTTKERAAMPAPLRAISWFVAVWLVVVYIPGALAARLVLAKVSPYVPEAWAQLCAFEGPQEIGDRDLVVVNDPVLFSSLMPFDRAYQGRPLPRTARALVPGLGSLEVERPDASTLILKAKGADLFECPALGPSHIGYGCKAAHEFLFGGRTWRAGEKVMRNRFMVEVLEVGQSGVPRAVACRFDKPLESEQMVWLFFDWRRMRHSPFVLPPVGARIEIMGPGAGRKKVSTNASTKVAHARTLTRSPAQHDLVLGNRLIPLRIE